MGKAPRHKAGAGARAPPLAWSSRWRHMVLHATIAGEREFRARINGLLSYIEKVG